MNIFDKFLRIRELGIFSIIIIVVVLASIIDSRFLTIDSWRAVFLAIPLILVMAMGQMMVIICRHVDISIGSILAFAAIIIGLIFIHYPNTSLWLALLITASVGLIMGLINGVIVTRFNVHSIIVTLGTLSLYRGLVFIVSGGRQIDRNDIPVHIISFSQTSFFFSIPAILIFSAIIVLITHLLMRHSVLGREIYATGSNPEAAHLKGINVTKVTLFCFGVCGMLAGVAGLFYASRFGYVNPGVTGVGIEFIVIAGVIIGGTSITGGSGSVLGTFLGILLLGIINVALPVLNIPGEFQKAIYGLIIVVALSLDQLIIFRMKKLSRSSNA
tara:strand:+ start:23192 stop:24178 length:987 start_codon:yes stop_codon:yes gene_type:complete